jgi:hypothetical protein
VLSFPFKSLEKWRIAILGTPGLAAPCTLAVSLLLATIGLDPLRLKFWANVLQGVLFPILVIKLWMIGNNRRIMGKNKLRLTTNFGLVVTALVMSGSSVQVFMDWRQDRVGDDRIALSQPFNFQLNVVNQCQNGWLNFRGLFFNFGAKYTTANKRLLYYTSNRVRPGAYRVTLRFE